LWKPSRAADAHNATYQRDGGKKGKERWALCGQARLFPNFIRHCLPPTLTPPVGAESLPGDRTLNPRFVEWLMGWPTGWTDCASAATGSFRWRRRLRSAYCSILNSIDDGNPHD
jgi:hypothetical protein